MAKLTDLLVSTKKVKGVEVHALTLSDIAQLVRSHEKAISKLFTSGAFDEVLVEFPEFVSSVIALGTNGNQEDAARLPAGIQLEFLTGIWEVSQVDTENLGKVIGACVAGLQKLTAPLQNGNPTLLK